MYQERFLELQENHTTTLQRVDELTAKLNERESYFVNEESKKKERLASLMEMIPEEKRSMVVTDLSVDRQLEYIEKHSDYLLGKQTPSIYQFSIPKHEKKEKSAPTLTAEELNLIKGKMPEYAALEMKTRNPDYFKRFLSKN